MRIIHLLEDHYSDYNRLGKRKGHFIGDILHSDFKDYFANSCFYYSSGSDATPIVGCKKFTNIFVYCDIQEFSNFSDAIFINSSSKTYIFLILEVKINAWFTRRKQDNDLYDSWFNDIWFCYNYLLCVETFY